LYDDRRRASPWHGGGDPPGAGASATRSGLSREHRRVGIEAEQDLADAFVMDVACLDLLRDGVDVAEAALKGLGVEDRSRAGHVIGGVDYLRRLVDRPGRGEAQRKAMIRRQRPA